MAGSAPCLLGPVDRVDTEIAPYASPRWLRGGHAQTMWPLAIGGALPRLERRRWATPDGDFIDLDFLPQRADRPLVVLFHGLEGSSRSPYARALMNAVSAKGWNGVVVHFRGCGGEPNRRPRAYHSGDADEIDWILREMVTRSPGRPTYAVGVSLGANALLCWLGTRGERATHVVTKAAAISAPLDLTASGHHLGRGFNRVYTRHFLKTMRRTIRNKARLFPGHLDYERALEARTLFEFDDAYTAPAHGFLDAHDYWRRASSKARLVDVVVPTLVLNAKNDPFLPREFLPSHDDVSSAIVLEQPEEGGHVGFVSGPFPGHLEWLPARVLAHFDVP